MFSKKMFRKKMFSSSKKRAFDDVIDLTKLDDDKIIIPSSMSNNNNEATTKIAKTTKDHLPYDIDSLSKLFEFGPKAFQLTMTTTTAAATTTMTDDISDRVISIIKKSLPKSLYTLRGERDRKEVTRMLYDIYQQGLFMHGSPSSPVNSIIIPAFRYIFAEISTLPSHDPKRLSILTTLVHACQDCQQVQAREILRLYQEMTCQRLTFEDQLLYSLVRLKESALHEYISRRHSTTCDLDHTRVQPYQQRAHLWSAYVVIVGEKYGLGNSSNITTARSDRFLGQALRYVYEIHDIPYQMDDHEFICDAIILPQLMNSISVKEWITLLLADINNQTTTTKTTTSKHHQNSEEDDDVNRMIHRRVLIEWAIKNLNNDDKYRIYYDDENHAEEYKDLEPNHPNSENIYQPFLSPYVLTKMMLVKVGMLQFIIKEK